MSGRLNPTRSVAEEAAYWIIRCNEQRPLPLQERLELATWARKSPQHVAELLRAFDLDQMLSKRSLPTVSTASRAGSNVIVMPLPVRKRTAVSAVRRRLPSSKVAAVAAVVIVGVLTASIVLTRGQVDVIKTGPGQLQMLTLTDGSKIHMDESSELKITFSRGQRMIELRSGRAVFSATNDVLRPFVVHTSVVDVTADGTQFAVELDGGVTTTVLQGAVKVTSHRHPERRNGVSLAQGERLPVSEQGLGSDDRRNVAKIDAASAPAWMSVWSDFGAAAGQSECKKIQSSCTSPVRQVGQKDAES